MLLSIVVSLYTSRVVLNALGVEDFGIYNVVGGIVVLFSFLNNATTNAVQRFLNYYMGKKDNVGMYSIFNVSLSFHILLIFIIVFLAETIGLWIVNYCLNIPAEKYAAANVVYQFTIVTFCLSLLKAPYNALIIAFEKMSFFAYMSVGEVLLKLIVAFLLLQSPFSRLEFYAVLLCFVSLMILIFYYVYCKKLFPSFSFYFVRDKSKYGELLSFSVWSLFGGITNIVVNQGGNILLNIFGGVVANTSLGIANQVGAAVYGFISNFQMAFNPQIVKLYSSGNSIDFYNLLFRATKISYYLMLVLSIPVLFKIEYVLSLWLGQLPLYSVEFCRLIILYCLIDALSGPLWMSVQANGNIKLYQVLMCIVLILNFPISYILLKAGLSPVWLLLVRLLLNVISYFVRLAYLKFRIDFPLNNYIREVFFRIFVVSLVSIIVSYMLFNYVFNRDAILEFVLGGLLWCLLFSIICFILGFNSVEKKYIEYAFAKLKNKICNE